MNLAVRRIFQATTVNVVVRFCEKPHICYGIRAVFSSDPLSTTGWFNDGIITRPLDPLMLLLCSCLKAFPPSFVVVFWFAKLCVPRLYPVAQEEIRETLCRRLG